MMKKVSLIKGLALGVMFALTTVASAGNGEGENAKVSIAPYLNTNYSVLSVANSSDKTAFLTILDTNGEVLYKEWVSKGGLTQKILDFTYLEDGEYKVSVKIKGLEEIKETFIVKDKKISVKGKEVVVSAESKAFVKLVDNILYVSHLSFGSPAFGISISTETNEEVFTKTIEGKETYSGKFDVSELPSGEYNVNINSGEKVFNYAFSK